MLTTEISCIYTQNGKCRRMHNLICMPDLKSVEEFNKRLGKVANIKSDGRPIVGLSSYELLKLALEVCPNCMFIPAHIWTPWFSLFGSKSGFDSIKECFLDLADFIKICETGLSSDPLMNWGVADLNGVTLISNSDAHSFEKLGREANMLDCELSYDAIKTCFLTRKGFLKTIEFYPEEGKYHYDGHRDCDVCLHPKESKKNNNICPVCKKKLTVGVLSRVMDLTCQKESEFKSKIPFINLIPLKEIIASHFGCGVNTKKVAKVYSDFILKFKNEFNVLLNLKEEDCLGFEHYDICCDIVKAREGKVEKQSGYDGVFGVIKVNKK